jgi:hypothetical protein
VSFFLKKGQLFILHFVPHRMHLTGAWKIYRKTWCSCKRIYHRVKFEAWERLAASGSIWSWELQLLFGSFC